VDDSATARRMLARSLSGEPDIEVVGEASDAAHAPELVNIRCPDVITLDIEMPGTDGLSFLRRLMRERPTPVIIVSSHVPPGSIATVEALRAGAVEVIAKPRGTTALGGLGTVLKEIIRGLRQSPVHVHAAVPRQPTARPVSFGAPLGDGLIAIGASAGGPQAIETILTRMPPDSPPILIVQHMPAAFVPLLAEQLNQACALRVGVAASGEEPVRGSVYLAPGDHHLLVDQRNGTLTMRLARGPRVHFQRPAVDVLFESLARVRDLPIVGVLLTGMGHDGAQGLLALRETGHETIAEDPRSCVVFGMPREAIARGAASSVLPVELIPPAIIGRFQRVARA